MANRILVLLVFMSTSPLFAQEEMYTLPITKARMLILDAFRARHLDSLQYFNEIHVKAITDDLMRCQADKEAIVQAEYVKNKAHDAMILETGARIQDLEGQVTKERKRGKLWKTLSTILAGAVLVETVLLVAD